MAAMASQNILVACETPVLSGGFIRFERFGRVATSRGHKIAFLALRHDRLQSRSIDFPVLTLEEASETKWDATMIPGAGFAPDVIGGFEQLKASNFGFRVQHILNDQTRRPRFLAVNISFQPHLVVFNNRHWPVGSYTEFNANQFHYIEGAVDIRQFAPAGTRRPAGNTFVVGGLANKNPMPLLESARRLDDIQLRLFGAPRDIGIKNADLVQSGKLRLPGVLDETGLADFYRDLDCVVHTETFAGWANLGAEALASGVPLICTPHGTGAFARDDASAIVIPEPSPDAIVAALTRLRTDPALREVLSLTGRQTIVPFTWERYADELLSLIQSSPERTHYAHAPEWGLYGKWPLGVRLHGLDTIIDSVAGKSVLDLGSAEGTISRILLDAGAEFVQGLERDPWRVQQAQAICQDSVRARFDTVDIGNWDSVRNNLARSGYDIVLYLGLHHHLAPQTRRETCARAADSATQIFAIRTPGEIYTADDLDILLRGRGFTLDRKILMNDATSPLRIFARVSPPTGAPRAP